MSTVEKGVYAAVLTPLNANLDCDVDELAAYSTELIERGCKGVLLFGTTGEGPSFSVLEKCRAIEGVIKRGIDPRKIIVGNGSANVEDTAELGFKITEMGCAGYLIAPPCFFTPVEQEGVFRFYEQAIRKISHPGLRVLLYHIPQYTGIPLSASLIHRLCAMFRGVVIGIKESEGNLSLIKEVLKTDPLCKVFIGRESFVEKISSLGAAGAICGIANLCPEALVSLSQQTAAEEDRLVFMKTVEQLKDKPFIAYAKGLVGKKRGEGWSRVRPPLLPFVF